MLRTHLQRRSDKAELEQAVQSALLRLPPDYRMVLTLVDIEGLDYAEAALVLRVPLGTVKSRLARAFAAARAALQRQPGLLPASPAPARFRWPPDECSRMPVCLVSDSLRFALRGDGRLRCWPPAACWKSAWRKSAAGNRYLPPTVPFLPPTLTVSPPPAFDFDPLPAGQKIRLSAIHMLDRNTGWGIGQLAAAHQTCSCSRAMEAAPGRTAPRAPCCKPCPRRAT